ncbi:6160_t:CDS:2, partial [Funneliformis mosseae]
DYESKHTFRIYGDDNYAINNTESEEFSSESDYNPKLRSEIRGEESIVDYYLKAKKYNDIIKLCKGHFRSEFYSGLMQENMRRITKNDYYCELVEILIQAKKESVTGIITGIKDYISQSGIANLNGMQY